MTIITSKRRKKLSRKKFGLPEEKKYPMPDKAHAANAKARATQMVKAGKLSLKDKEKIDRKADKILGKPASKSKTASKRKILAKRKSTSKRRAS